MNYCDKNVGKFDEIIEDKGNFIENLPIKKLKNFIKG